MYTKYTDKNRNLQYTCLSTPKYLLASLSCAINNNADVCTSYGPMDNPKT